MRREHEQRFVPAKRRGCGCFKAHLHLSIGQGELSKLPRHPFTEVTRGGLPQRGELGRKLVFFAAQPLKLFAELLDRKVVAAELGEALLCLVCVGNNLAH